MNMPIFCYSHFISVNLTCVWMGLPFTWVHPRSHFSPFQIDTQLWFFPPQNGCRRPFWMTENHFWSHFSPFQINTQLLFFSQNDCRGHFGWPKITFDRISRHFRSIRSFYLFGFYIDKMAAGGHFGWPKITFFRISRHFRSIRYFYFCSQNGCRRPFWMTEIHFRSHFSPNQINTQHLFFHKMAAGGQFGWPKITFDRISRHFHKIIVAGILINTQLFFSQNNSCGHFGWPKITFDRISRHFRSICNFYWFWFFWQNGCRRPFWMTENHFLSHFSPFQINTLLLFLFTKWRPAAILDDRKSLSITCRIMSAIKLHSLYITFSHPMISFSNCLLRFKNPFALLQNMSVIFILNGLNRAI